MRPHSRSSATPLGPGAMLAFALLAAGSAGDAALWSARAAEGAPLLVFRKQIVAGAELSFVLNAQKTIPQHPEYEDSKVPQNAAEAL